MKTNGELKEFKVMVTRLTRVGEIEECNWFTVWAETKDDAAAKAYQKACDGDEGNPPGWGPCSWGTDFSKWDCAEGVCYYTSVVDEVPPGTPHRGLVAPGHLYAKRDGGRDRSRNTVKMIDDKFEDINGRKYRLYTVRSMGPGRGFGILNRYRNTFDVSPFSKREDAWNYLKTEES